MLLDTFEELMAEELGIAQWIEERDMTFLVKVLGKAAEKNHPKPGSAKKDKAVVMPPTTPASQPTQPAFKLGGQS